MFGFEGMRLIGGFGALRWFVGFPDCEIIPALSASLYLHTFFCDCLFGLHDCQYEEMAWF